MFCWREILPFGKPRSLLLKDLIYVKKNKTHDFFSSRILKVSFWQSNKAHLLTMISRTNPEIIQNKHQRQLVLTSVQL